MKKNLLNTSVFLILMISLILAFALPVMADKPQSTNKGGSSSKSHKKDKNKKNDNDDATIHVYFNDQQRNTIRNYYHEEYKTGHCPPGLAKKNNGCMPPGQAKKWKKGYPLPHDVVYYDLPSSIVVELGRPPEGHRYIRVASDILLMATGTGMIVDAIEDLNSM